MVTWSNKDDVPHIIVNTQMKFLPSKVLDTDQHFSHTFTQPGTYDYYCSIHPKMTAKVIVPDDLPSYCLLLASSSA